MSEVRGAGQPQGPGRPPSRLDASSSALAAFGVELRALRGRRQLTLQGLAELTGYSPQHLGAVERAKVVPSEAVATACDVALAANGRLVTLLAGVIREQADGRNRREVARRSRRSLDERSSGELVGVQETALGDDVDWGRLADAGRRASRVTPAVVHDLEQITDRQRRLYHELSSAEMLVHVRAHLGLLTALLDGHQVDRLRPRIASAAAEAAGFAAWLWFDLGDVFHAQRLYREAAAAVEEAGDRGLGAYLRGYQGMIAARSDGPDHALAHLVEASRLGRRSLSGTTRSWLTVLEAETLARTGQPEAAVAAVGRAEELLTEGASLSDPWMYDFDRGSLAAHAGNCYLAVQQPRRAAASFEDALRLLPASCDRRGARISIGLARARLASGDGDEALRLATDALTTFITRGSVAGVHHVRDLRGELARAGLAGAVAALDEHARALGSLAG